MSRNGTIQTPPLPPVGSFGLSLRVLRDAHKRIGSLVVLVFLGLLATPLALLAPFPLKLAVDSVLGSQPLPASLAAFTSGALDPSSILIFACVATFTVLLAQSVHAYGLWTYQLTVGEMLVLDARTKLFRHVQRLSLLRHAEHGAPDLLFRLQNDVSNMQYIAVYGLIPLCSSVVMFATMFVVTFRIDWQLAVLALGVLPLLWLLNRWHAGHSRARWNLVKEAEGRAVGVIQEVLGGIHVVKAFAQEDRETARFRTKGELNLKRYLGAVWVESIFGILVATMIALASALALYIGVTHVQQNMLSIGSFLIVIAYLAQLFKPLEIFSKQIASTQASLASAERVYALLDAVPEIHERPNAIAMTRARGEVEFKSVAFGYSADREVLKGIDLKIASGTRVGIVGPTGSGKSTLIHLIGRFLDPTRGAIFLDGVDLRDLRLDDLRAQFAFVLQEPMLFTGTIAENIAYGRPGASRDAIAEAARAAGAFEFITELPDGFDTFIGEGATRLSGGEKQRVSIARAYLIDAPILILDEPTSSVDVAQEALMTEALDRLRLGRTTFTISHRHSLLKNHDLILHLNDGQLNWPT